MFRFQRRKRYLAFLQLKKFVATVSSLLVKPVHEDQANILATIGTYQPVLASASGHNND